MPSEDYHLQRYHARRKWRRYHGLLLLGSILTGVGILIAPLFGIRAYQHASKASEHRDDADREMLPDSTEPEGVISCPNCEEPIERDMIDCLHCGDTRWTKDRRDDYLVFWLPILSMSAGILVSLLLGVSRLSLVAMVLTIIGVYALTARYVNDEYHEEQEWLEQHNEGAA